MIQVTGNKGNKVKINEGNIVALKPQQNGETSIYLSKNIPKPDKPNYLVNRFRVTQSMEDLKGLRLKKYESVQDESYWYINQNKILSERETEEGVRIFLSSDLSNSNSPFSTNRLHLKEVN